MDSVEEVSIKQLCVILGKSRPTVVARLKGIDPVRMNGREKLYKSSEAMTAFMTEEKTITKWLSVSEIAEMLEVDEVEEIRELLNGLESKQGRYRLKEAMATIYGFQGFKKKDDIKQLIDEEQYLEDEYDDIDAIEIGEVEEIEEGVGEVSHEEVEEVKSVVGVKNKTSIEIMQERAFEKDCVHSLMHLHKIGIRREECIRRLSEVSQTGDINFQVLKYLAEVERSTKIYKSSGRPLQDSEREKHKLVTLRQINMMRWGVREVDYYLKWTDDEIIEDGKYLDSLSNEEYRRIQEEKCNILTRNIVRDDPEYMYYGSDQHYYDDKSYIPNSVDDSWLSDGLTTTLWYEGNLDYKRHAGQMRAREFTERILTANRIIFPVWLTTRRWGKSTDIGNDDLAFMMRHAFLGKDHYKTYVFQRSQKQGWGTYFPIFKKLTIDAPPGLVKYYKNDCTIAIGDSLFNIVSYEQIDSIRGFETANHIRFDEAGFMDPSEFHYCNSAAVNLMQHSKKTIMYKSSAPRNADHPFAKVVEEARKNGHLYEATIYDNPTLSDGRKEEVIAQHGGIDSVYAQRELFCKIYDDRSGKVIKGFTKDNIVEEIKVERYGNITINDRSNKNHHDVWLFCLYDFVKDILYILDELVFKKPTHNSIKVEEVRKKERVVYAGESAHRMSDCTLDAVDIFADTYNLAVERIKNSSKDEQIQEADNGLYQGKIRIHSRCVYLIGSVNETYWNKTYTNIKESKEYGHGDGVMALVYAYSNRKKARRVKDLEITEFEYNIWSQSYKSSYIGVVWKNIQTDEGWIISLSDNGNIIASAELKGSYHEKMKIIHKIVMNSRKPKLMYDVSATSSLLQDEMGQIGCEVEKIELDSVTRKSLFYELKYEVERDGIKFDSTDPRLEVYYDAVKYDDELDYINVDAMMIANRMRSKDILKNREINRGGLIKKSNIRYYGKDMDIGKISVVTSVTAIEEGGSWVYVKKSLGKKYNFWHKAGRCDTEELLSLFDKNKKGVLFVSNEESVKILRLRAFKEGLRLSIKSFEVTGSQSDLVEGFRDGREVFPEKEDWVEHVLGKILIFPKDGLSYLQCGYKLDISRIATRGKRA